MPVLIQDKKVITAVDVNLSVDRYNGKKFREHFNDISLVPR